MRAVRQLSEFLRAFGIEQTAESTAELTLKIQQQKSAQTQTTPGNPRADPLLLRTASGKAFGPSGMIDVSTDLGNQSSLDDLATWRKRAMEAEARAKRAEARATEVESQLSDTLTAPASTSKASVDVTAMRERKSSAAEKVISTLFFWRQKWTQAQPQSRSGSERHLSLSDKI